MDESWKDAEWGSEPKKKPKLSHDLEAIKKAGGFGRLVACHGCQSLSLSVVAQANGWLMVFLDNDVTHWYCPACSHIFHVR